MDYAACKATVKANFLSGEYEAVPKENSSRATHCIAWQHYLIIRANATKAKVDAVQSKKCRTILVYLGHGRGSSSGRRHVRGCVLGSVLGAPLGTAATEVSLVPPSAEAKNGATLPYFWAPRMKLRKFLQRTSHKKIF